MPLQPLAVRLSFFTLRHYLACRAGWLRYGSDMTANFYGAICGWTVCFAVTSLVSLFAKKRPAEELAGLVYDLRNQSVGQNPQKMKRAWILSGLILLAMLALNWIFY